MMETAVLPQNLSETSSDVVMPGKDACRICWSQIIGEGFHIKSKASHSNLTFSEMYSYVSGIEPDYLPDSLCWGCAKDLTTACKMMKKIEEKENIKSLPRPPRIETPEIEEIKPTQSSTFEMVVIKIEPQDYSEMENSDYEFENADEDNQDFSSYDEAADEEFKLDDKKEEIEARPRKKPSSSSSSKKKKKKYTYKPPPKSGNLIQCVQCIYNTYIKENYVNHVQNHHKGQKLKCDGCHKIYDYIDELNEHRKEKHDFTEKYVLQLVPEKKEEKLLEPKTELKSEVASVSQVISPVKTTEEEKKEYKLDCLGRKIPLNRNYKKREIKWPRKERKLPIQCPLCPYTGIGKSNFRNHYRSKHNKQQLQCDGCDLKFHLFYRLYRHREEDHHFTHEYVVDESLKVPEGTMYAPRPRTKKEDKEVNCPQCNILLRGPRKLQDHLRDVHNYVKESPRYKVICNFCGKFVVNYNLEAHIRHLHPEQRDPFICDYCGDKVKSKTSLLRHFQSVHRVALKYRGAPCALMCRYCPIVFKSKHQRQAHEIRLHTFDYKFKCGICDKKFMKKQHLVVHVGRHAKGKIKQSRLNCHICGELFSRKRILAEHITTHFNNSNASESNAGFSDALAQNLAHLVSLKYEQNQEQNSNASY